MIPNSYYWYNRATRAAEVNSQFWSAQRKSDQAIQAKLPDINLYETNPGSLRYIIIMAGKDPGTGVSKTAE